MKIRFRQGTRDMIAWAESLGWVCTRTRNGHLCFRHPRAAYPIFGPSTPSCSRSWKNMRALMRRAIAA